MIPKPEPRTLSNRFKLVGVCGKAGSGKDTVYNYLNLRKPSDELWVARFALADTLKEAASTIFGLDTAIFSERAIKEEPMAKLGGLSPRQVAQKLGTESVREVFGIWTWVAALHSKLQNCVRILDAAVVTDIRFQNEVQWVLEQDGILVYLQRDGLGNVGIKNHASEKIPSIEFCQNAVATYGGSLVVIENNGSLQEFHAAIEKQLVPLLLQRELINPEVL